MAIKGELIGKFDHLNLDELATVASFLIKQQDRNIWLFEGEMGAGKTTLIKSICNSFAIADSVTSPTYSIINEYESGDGKLFYHFDFYRIENENEAIDIGVDDYFYSDAFCFIEWPEKISSLVPDEFLRIFIIVNADNTRSIAVEKV